MVLFNTLRIFPRKTQDIRFSSNSLEQRINFQPFSMSAAGVSTWMTSHRSLSDVTYQVVWDW